MSYSAPIDVFRNALVLIGAEPPSSISDQTAEAIAANAVYENIVTDLLCEHAWTFATKRATLTYQGESGDAPTYVYSLPNDMLRPRRVLLSLDEFGDYEIRANALYCNIPSTTEIDLIYNWRAPESSWSPDFGKIVVYKLAAEVAMAFERYEIADRMEAKAIEALPKARARDRRASGKVTAFENSLGRTWRGTVDRGYTRVSSS